jgi:hypothetical protein
MLNCTAQSILYIIKYFGMRYTRIYAIPVIIRLDLMSCPRPTLSSMCDSWAYSVWVGVVGSSWVSWVEGTVWVEVLGEHGP